MTLVQSKNKAAPEGYVSIDEYEKLRKEFEEFVYIISHDLQAPLRHTREFNKLLLNNMHDEGSDEQKLYVDNIQLGVDHAEAMIEGMLKYSRLNTQVDLKNTIDLSALIDVVVEKHADQVISSATNIFAEAMPDIFANQPQIEQLFSILFDNSLKNQNPQTSPNIKITAEPIEKGHRFSVEDNGTGMNANTRSIAFEIFRPIRKFNDHSGIGIGLTMAKKIVESHGGEIWVDPEFTAGTKINFTIIDER